MSDTDDSFLRFDPEESTDRWGTPLDIWRPLSDAVGGFDLDPCSGAESNPIATTTYTERGLEQPWYGTVWVNPPYSGIGPWAERCHRGALDGEFDTALLLVPARTSPAWWHDYIVPADLLLFFEGRLSFYNLQKQPTSAPFASVLAVYGAVPDDLLPLLDGWGAVYTSGDRWQATEQTTLPTHTDD